MLPALQHGMGLGAIAANLPNRGGVLRSIANGEADALAIGRNSRSENRAFAFKDFTLRAAAGTCEVECRTLRKYQLLAVRRPTRIPALQFTQLMWRPGMYRKCPEFIVAGSPSNWGNQECRVIGRRCEVPAHWQMRWESRSGWQRGESTSPARDRRKATRSRRDWNRPITDWSC